MITRGFKINKEIKHKTYKGMAKSILCGVAMQMQNVETKFHPSGGMTFVYLN